MEAALRLGIFLGVFALTAVLELTLPRRPRTQPVGRRWLTNLGILLVDVAAQRLTVGAAAFAAALWAEQRGIGLFHLLAWPGWIEGLLGFLVLDAAIWLQHVITHKVPVLWRLHQVHHADLDVDLTTGIRFHPIEIVLSLLYKAAIVLALGIDPWAVVLFEAVLNASAVLTHGNVARAGAAGHRAALGRLHARHAPGAPLDRARRDRQQFRLLPVRVGPAVPHHASRPGQGSARRGAGPADLSRSGPPGVGIAAGDAFPTEWASRRNRSAHG